MPEIDRKKLAILRALDTQGEPLGSSRLAQELANLGVDLTDRAVRYQLQQLDEAGLTESLGRAGRRITEVGRQELADASVSDRVTLIISTLERLTYQTSFDLATRQGKVVVNISLLPAEALDTALQVMRPVFLAGLCTSDLIAVYRSGQRVGDAQVPAGMVAIGTICSVTINGILLNYGISMESQFGGLLELAGHKPVRFTDVIHYGGTSLDPLEIFIKGKMTSVTQAARTGAGKVGAGFRLIPATAYDQFLEITDQMAQAGIRGVASVGRPSHPLLEIAVPLERAGVILYAGLNPGAAIEEAGIETTNHAMGALVDFSELTSYRRL